MHRSRLISILTPLLTIFSFLILLEAAVVLPTKAAGVVLGSPDMSEEETDWKRVIVFFHDSETIEGRFETPDRPPEGDVSRYRSILVSALKTNAAAVEQQITPAINQWKQDGVIHSPRFLWLPNALAVSVSPAGLEELVRHPLVEKIVEDELVFSFSDELPDIFALQTANGTPEDGNSGLKQIQVPAVWHGLGITGTQATVAIIDTGVDWLHPDLITNYRGRLPNGTVDHSGSWYHAAHPTVTTPIDEFWHGTHVAGTAVGGSNLGVAPGAQWIGVSIADHDGFLYNSYIFAAFEWVLAPGGRPELAPDVINGSWGSPSTFTFFVDEIDLLRQAGIVPIFSAGNDGPFGHSVGIPASYTNTVAVGAVDGEEELAWFSSRGPSSLSPDFKPDVVAPGVKILSTVPNEGYGRANGTSMAAPHVAGVVALLRAANPALSVNAIEATLRQTARPLDGLTPNMTSGWGLVDAYAAVTEQMPVGRIEGQLLRQGSPVAGETVTLTTSTGQQLPFDSDKDGHFTIAVAPGTYRLTAHPFGFQSHTTNPIAIAAGETVFLSLELVREAGATIQGQLLLNGQPAAGSVDLLTHQQTFQTDGMGRFEFYLPAGDAHLRFRAVGGRSAERSILVTAGIDQHLGQDLARAPKILVVDGGRWHFSPVISWYQTALWDAGYDPASWSILDPLEDIPTVDHLKQYDAVFWGDPRFAPGTIGATPVISTYLDDGGRLFIAGQNIAEFEASNFGVPWIANHLNARWDGNTTITTGISGAPHTPLAGLEISLNQGSSSGNLTSLDRLEPLRQTLAEPAFSNGSGEIVGLRNGHCRPFQLIGVGFGLEDVSDASDRQAIVESALDYFAAEAPDRGVRWMSNPQQAIVGRGQTYEIDLYAQNLSENYTETFDIELFSSEWSAEVMTSSLTIGFCENKPTRLIVPVPEDAPPDSKVVITATIRSRSYPAESADLAVEIKTPASILFVNDYRWYDPQEVYQAALNTLDVTYDIWVTDRQYDGRGSPPAELLPFYDRVIWATSYDWFRPILPEESKAIESYLDSGGRLLLSSQDFMSHHHRSLLTRHYLGVIGFNESVTPTVMVAPGGPFYNQITSDLLPIRFDLYLNNSDGLVPAPNAEPLLWHDRGVAAVGRFGETDSGDMWRTVVIGFPLENTPTHTHLPLLNAGLGYLSDWGNTTLSLSHQVVQPGESVTVTLDLRGSHQADTMTVTMSSAGANGLVHPILGDPGRTTKSEFIVWVGKPADARQLTFVVQTPHDLNTGDVMSVVVQLDDGYLPWTLEAGAVVDGANLSNSKLVLTPSTTADLIVDVDATLTLINDGVRTATAVSTAVAFSSNLFILTDTLSSGGGVAVIENGQLIWQGSLPPGETVTTTVSLTATQPTRSQWETASGILVSDQSKPTIILDHLKITAHEIILPLIFNQFSPPPDREFTPLPSP